MRVIPPITVTDAMLTSSTAPEPGAGEVAWNSGTAYTVGATCYLASNHRRYECLIAHTNEDPLTDTDGHWSDLGPTNKWAMFDTLRNTQTEIASPLTVVITPGQRVDAIGVIGMDADTVTISVSSVLGGGVVYSYTENLQRRRVFGWYDYFTQPFSYKTAIVKDNIPPYSDAVITVTLTKSTGNVKCGGVTIGKAVYLGEALAGAENDGLNFSRIERDEFGDVTLTPRRTIPKISVTVLAEKYRTQGILDVRETLNAVPALWYAIENTSHDYFEAMLVFGPYRRFTTPFGSPRVEFNLEIEEM
jgi:hypothetical protein